MTSAAVRTAPGAFAREPSAAERVAATVLADGDVVELSDGPLGHFRSYVPGGGTVEGVRIDARRIEVNVVVRWGPPVYVVGARLAAALRTESGGRAVTVHIADVAWPARRADSAHRPD